MDCDRCKGNGEIYSAVTGRTNVCNICCGTGELESCKDFNPGVVLPVFRNGRCISCNVRYNNHIMPAGILTSKV